MDTIYAGPKRGADRAVLLAHGAGTDMHAATLGRVADALAAAKIPSLRFNYPYRDAGRKSPDRAAVLDAATREAAGELARRTKLPPEQLTRVPSLDLYRPENTSTVCPSAESSRAS